jgi:hypothetical protein
MVRRTCRAAWLGIQHPAVHKGNIVDIGLKDRHVPLLEWAVSIGANVDADSVRAMATLGSEQLTCLLVSTVPKYYEAVIEGLAEGGHGPTLEGLLSDPRVIEHHVTMVARREMASRALVGCVQLVNSDATWWRENMLSWVLGSGDLEFVQWVVGDAVLDVDAGLANHAAQGGSTGILAFLVERGVTLTAGTARAAALHGHLDALRWLVAHGCPLDGEALVEAARAGHVHVLEYLVDELDMPLVDNAAYGAAYKGQLATLQWLVAHDCPLDEAQVARCACVGTDDKILRWWVEAGYRWERDQCLATANNRRNAQVARFIHEHGGDLGADFLASAAIVHDLDEFRYGVAHGASVTSRAITLVVHQHQVAIMAYIIDEGLFELDEGILQHVRRYGSPEMRALLEARGYKL